MLPIVIILSSKRNEFLFYQLISFTIFWNAKRPSVFWYCVFLTDFKIVALDSHSFRPQVCVCKSCVQLVPFANCAVAAREDFASKRRETRIYLLCCLAGPSRPEVNA
jgi:hypothetical protein